MHWQIESMDRWPYPSTAQRKSSPFRSKWGDTLTLLERELNHLGVAGAVALRVVTSDQNVRRDGMLYAKAKVDHPGVILAFQSKHGPLSYPCDTYIGRYYEDPADWQTNVRAIALALEALRTVDRYGVTRRGEQYTGWRAIEAAPASNFASTDEALAWLRSFTAAPDTSTVAVVLAAAKARATRNRESGDLSTWNRYDVARQLLERDGISHTP